MSTVILLLVVATSIVVQSPRWLRVAQREHYLPDVARFAARWWRVSWLNRLLGTVMVLGVVGSLFNRWAIVVVALMASLGPVGLSVRGRTSPLTWTGRLRRLACGVASVVVLVVVADRLAGTWIVTALAIAGLPLVVDSTLAVLRPLEARLGGHWVRQATTALGRSGARVVAITGSFGKTTTKNVVAHLLSGVTTVVPSPASFNNRMGLARAINEQLGSATDVFVAEMGTYGKGEIADLCEWIPPDVAVITALGPVHLERMGSEEAILEAKREILADAPVAVLSIDHPLLAALADEETANRSIVRCSTVERSADVHVDDQNGAVSIRGEVVGTAPPDRAHPGNVACALGVVLALGFDPARVTPRLVDLPPTPHRQTVDTSDLGFQFIDDTFNSNPEGARAALGKLQRLAGDGRSVLVTPGMVELGKRQYDENRALGESTAEYGVDAVVVVGHTNRAALLEGATNAGVSTVIVVDDREAAVAWVRGNLGAGDTVLYENDLPDHYP